MSKKKYEKPAVINLTEEVHTGVPGAAWGALLMVARALSKAMKGGVDAVLGVSKPKVLQNPNEDK